MMVGTFDTFFIFHFAFHISFHFDWQDYFDGSDF